MKGYGPVLYSHEWLSIGKASIGNEPGCVGMVKNRNESKRKGIVKHGAEEHGVVMVLHCIVRALY